MHKNNNHRPFIIAWSIVAIVLMSNAWSVPPATARLNPADVFDGGAPEPVTEHAKEAAHAAPSNDGSATALSAPVPFGEAMTISPLMTIAIGLALAMMGTISLLFTVVVLFKIASKPTASNAVAPASSATPSLPSYDPAS